MSNSYFVPFFFRSFPCFDHHSLCGTCAIKALEASGIQLPPQAAAAYAGQQAQPQFYGQVQATAAPQTAEEQYAQFMASAMSGQGGQQQQQPALAYDAYGQLTQR
jgi:hypothetical protein